MGNFRLPADALIFQETIFNRCDDLIRSGIWSGIDPIKLNIWKNNFETPEEKYFAAKILDQLVYRSRAQTVALLTQLYSRSIPDAANSGKLPVDLHRISELMRQTADPNIRIVPVVFPDDPPTKSGNVICRLLKRNLRFNEDWIVTSENLKLCNQRCVIFVDDFLGSGDQFSEFLEFTGLNNDLQEGKFLYAPLVGHVDGFGKLAREFPKLRTTCVEQLNESHGFFTGNKAFPDGENDVDTAREFYYQFLAKNGIDLARERRGYGQNELLYAFEDAAPDNSLPVLWFDHSDDWQPLFNR